MVSILALRDLGDGVSLSKKPKMWQMPSSLDMDVLQEKSESAITIQIISLTASEPGKNKAIKGLPLKVPRGNCFVK